MRASEIKNGPDTGNQPVLARRVAAAQATLDEFKDKPFKWGACDCARLVAAHVRRMGYAVRLPPTGAYRSRAAARAEMDKRGYKTLADALDGIGLERIAPAAALVGDILEMPAADDMGALAIQLTNGRAAGFHEATAGVCVIQPVKVVAAWCCPPQEK